MGKCREHVQAHCDRTSTHTQYLAIATQRFDDVYTVNPSLIVSVCLAIQSTTLVQPESITRKLFILSTKKGVFYWNITAVYTTLGAAN